MLEGSHVGLKVDVDTLRGTNEGVPRLVALLKKYGLDATFYFSVGPDHTGRALRRVFRPGFFQKVSRTSVVKHYGLKTLLYGVLLPGPDIGRAAGAVMRGAFDAGFEVGLHTYDHVRWQDYVAQASAEWTRVEFERGLAAFERVFGFLPQSHAAAGWQINDHALSLEAEHGLLYASDTRVAGADVRDATPFHPLLGAGSPLPGAGTRIGACLQIPTTLPTFDELLGLDGIDESTVGDAVFERSKLVPPSGMHVFTLHAELEGLRLLGAFEGLLRRWRDAGVVIARMARLNALAQQRAWPSRSVVLSEIPGRSGLLAVAGANPAAAA